MQFHRQLPRLLLFPHSCTAQKVHALKTCRRHVFLTGFRIHPPELSILLLCRKKQYALSNILLLAGEDAISSAAAPLAAVSAQLHRAESPRPKNVPPARFPYGLPNPSSRTFNFAFIQKKSSMLFQTYCFWWERMDSDHRSYKATDLQSAPFGHSGTLPYYI